MVYFEYDNDSFADREVITVKMTMGSLRALTTMLAMPSVEDAIMVLGQYHPLIRLTLAEGLLAHGRALTKYGVEGEDFSDKSKAADEIAVLSAKMEQQWARYQEEIDGASEDS